jgi:hypothetical protein
VQLGIEFAARVVLVGGNRPIARDPILIGTAQADPRGSVTLRFCKRILNSLIMCRDKPFVPSNKGLYGNRLRRREGQIVQRASFALPAPILSESVRAVARAKKFTGLRVQSLSDGFELLSRHLAAQAE